MTDAGKRRLATEALAGYEPEIGRLLWMLEDARERTRRVVAGLGDVDLYWAPTPRENSIGALLYHIAAIEADWLYFEVLQAQEFPQDVVALFPEDVRNEEGQLALARGYSLDEHFERLDFVRARLLEAFRGMTNAELRHERDLPDYAVTPEWVLHHLMQHEAGHRAEIGMLRWLPISGTIGSSGMDSP